MIKFINHAFITLTIVIFSHSVTFGQEISYRQEKVIAIVVICINRLIILVEWRGYRIGIAFTDSPFDRKLVC